ncbi:MAG: autoinducer binding domain-containing protein [Pseudomonadota bacterium]
MNVALPQRLEKVLRSVEAATEREELQDAVVDLRDLLNIDHLIYHWVSNTGDQFAVGTYSPEWAARYVERDYQRIDPVITGAYQRFHPVDWRRLDWSSKPAKALMEDAAEHGVGSQGFSVPLRGPNGQFALFTANDSCDEQTWDAFIETYRRNLLLIAHYFNQKALEFERDRVPGTRPSLSPREIDAMTLLALGYGRAQVAQSLAISEHTLRVYIESARHKLGAINTVHAVARALSLGLIVV